MNKYVNYLLFGFLLFIIGLVIVNFDLRNYKYVNYLPDDYEMDTEIIKIKLDNNKNYKIKKAKNHKNIIIDKREIYSNDDETITIEINHTSTSIAYGLVNSFGNNVNVILYNESKISGMTDLIKIYDLFVRCIKEKRVYNYNLLKYSKVVVKGSAAALEKVEVVDYAL